MSGLNILYVIDRFDSPGAGTEGQLWRLVRGMQARGHQVRLLILAPSPWIEANGFPCPVDVLGRTQVSRPATWLAMFRYARQCRKDGIQLVQCFFNDASVLCPPIFRMVGIPVLISRRDMGFWYTSLYRKVLPFTGRFVTAVVVNSQAVAEITARVERIPTSRIEVIYNGYESGDVDAVFVPELEGFRKLFPVVFMLVANQRPIKRIQDAIRALAMIVQKGVNAGLVLVGGGDWIPLQKLARDLGVAENVCFLGPRSDAQACLGYADIGILCSESEGFSNAIVEYMQAGLPVICTDTGGNPEAVRNGREGYVVPVADVEALAGAMRALAMDPQLRKQLGEQARLSASQRFGMDRMLAQHEALYRRVTGVPA